MTKIAIIVLNYKQPKLTIDTIDSILQISHKKFDYQIFLIDNLSPDNSIDLLEEKYGKNKKITILNTGQNLGYSGGNNFGINKALKLGYDYCLIINNDVIVDKNFLQYLFDRATKEKLPSIVGPKIYFAKGYEFHKDRYKKDELGNVIWSAGGKLDWNNIYGTNVGVDEVDKAQYDTVNYDLDFLTGCCFLVSSIIFKKLGAFNDKYFMYLEDLEFCIRTKKAGGKLIYEPKAFIWHVNSGSSGSGSSLHDYFITRNRLLFGLKYAKFRTKFALYRESLKLLIIGRKWQKKGIIDYFRKKFYKGSWK